MNRNEFKKAAADYIASLPSNNKSVNTICKYKQVLTRFADYLEKISNGKNSAVAITPTTICNFREYLYADGAGVCTNTIRDYLTVLHGFFEARRTAGKMRKNPVLLTDIPEAAEIEHDILTSEDLNALLFNISAVAHMHKKNAARNKAIVTLLLQTGLRNSELRALTPAVLNFERGEIVVKRGKGGKSRVVPFPKQSRIAVREYLNSRERPKRLTANDILFGTDADKNGHPTRGKEWHPMAITTLNKIVKAYIKNAVNRDAHCHTLRHMACSGWAERGVPMRDVQLALGHASMATTERVYTHVLNRSSAANRINAAFGG